MNIKWVRVFAACVLAGLTACSQNPAQPQGDSSSEGGKNAKIFTDLAMAYFQRGQYKVALSDVRKAITTDSKYGPAYDVLGLIYMELAEDQLAEENFRKAIELDRMDSEAHNNFGWFLCTRGRYAEGLSQFTDALRNPLYERPEQALANEGLCHEMEGDLANSEASFIKAMKLQPEYPLALIGLAKLKYRQKRYNEALSYLDRYHAVTPPTAASLWLGVRIEHKLGDKAREGEYAGRLHRQFPDSKEDDLMTSGHVND
jgi:type IV pilus assembly protein PilF